MSPDPTVNDDDAAARLVAQPADTPATIDSTPPDIEKLEGALHRRTTQSAGITLLVVLAIAFTLYFGRAFLLPLTLAALLKFLLGPVVRALTRVHISAPFGAAIVLITLLISLGAAGYAVSGPAHRWIADAPNAIKSATTKLRSIRQSVEQMTRTAQQVAHATNMNETPAQEVVVRGPSVVSRVFGSTASGVTAALEVVILLYFLLAAGDMFLEKLVKMLPNLRDKKTAVRIARGIETSVSTYLFTITVINVCEGAVLAGALYLLGAPSPLLWGVLAALLEYMPYVGAGTMIVVLTLVGLTSFTSVGHAMALPATFLPSISFSPTSPRRWHTAVARH